MTTFDPWNYRQDSGFTPGNDITVDPDYRDRLGNYYEDYYKRGM